MVGGGRGESASEGKADLVSLPLLPPDTPHGRLSELSVAGANGLSMRGESPGPPSLLDVPGLYDMGRAELAGLLPGEPDYRMRQVWDGLYRRGLHPREMTDLPLPLRRALDDRLQPMLAEEARRT